MRDNVYWINSAALVRPENVFPLAQAGASPPADELPHVCLILPIPPLDQPRPYRCDCVEWLQYSRDKFDVVFISDGIPAEELGALRHRIDHLVADGMSVKLVIHEKRRGQIAVLDEAIGKADCDIILLADLTVPLPPEAILKAAAIHAERSHQPPSP